MSKAKARFGLVERDRGLKKILAMAQRVAEEKPYVAAGVIGPKAEKSRGPGVTNVDLAVIHEFGAPAAGIPERSFIRAPFEANRAKYEAMMRQLVRGIYELELGERQGLGLLGLTMATDMKKAITTGAGIPPPNSPAVYARKLAKGRSLNGGEPRPLVDTGQLLGAISWAVIDGAEAAPTPPPAEEG